MANSGERYGRPSFLREDLDVDVTNKVFVIGLSHTGTRSTAAALQILGYNVVHFPHDKVAIESVLAGDSLATVAQTCDGIADVGAALYHRDLLRRFPNAKFVLTTRQADQWHSACAKHWARYVLTIDDLSSSNSKRVMQVLMRLSVYGSLHYSFPRFESVRVSHLEEVRRTFLSRPESLLELSPSDPEAWERLSAHVGRLCPTEAFPHVS